MSRSVICPALTKTTSLRRASSCRLEGHTLRAAFESLPANMSAVARSLNIPSYFVLDIEHMFDVRFSPMVKPSAFAELRERFDQRFRDTSQAAFTLADDAVLRTGIAEFDRVLGGGLPRGSIATLEGVPSSGRMAVAARLLAVGTSAGLGAVVGTSIFPPALAAAGVRLERLLVVSTSEPVGAA